MKLAALSLVPFLALMGQALAAEDSANMMLEEIVVRGQKESPNQESLNIREVRESSARDMGEALQSVEGINIVRKGAIANDIVLRGFQKDNINVLMDGARLHGACPNRMDSPSFHYDFAEIEQVNVIKGPYDLSNPGGMGGTVDAITKKPRKGPGADLNMTYGSYNSVNASAVASYGADKADILAGYAYKQSDVPKSGDGKMITDIYDANSSNRYKSADIDSNAYKINTAWGRFGVKPGDNSRMDLSYSYQDARHVLYPYLLMDAVYDRTSMVNWTYKLTGASSALKDAKLQFFWNRVNHLMDDRYRQSSAPSATVTRDYSMQTDASTEMLGAKLSGAASLGGGVIRGGLDYYRRNWNALNRRSMYTMGSPYTLLNMIPDADISNAGVFAEYELPLGETITAKGGMRVDIARAKANSDNPVVSAGRSRDFTELGANLQLAATPAEGLEIFTGVARSSRIPDQKELFISVPGTKNTFGNPELSATNNYEADIGAKYSGESFYVNGSVFYSSLKDYINLRGYQVGAVRNLTYENIDANMRGAELGSQVSLPLDLFLRGSFSYAEGQNETGGRPLSEIAPFKALMSLRYDKGSYFVEAAENISARQTRVDTSLQETETPGWATTDFKAGYFYKGISLYAGVCNIFDEYYFSYLSYLRDPFASGAKVPENGRNFYVTLAWKF